MKKAKYSLPLKVTAVILSFFTVAITVGGCIGMILLMDWGFYTNSNDSIKRDTFEDISSDSLYRLVHKTAIENVNNKDLIDEYAETNLYFSVSDSEQNVIHSNYNGEEYFAKNSREFVATIHEDQLFDIYYSSEEPIYGNAELYGDENSQIFTATVYLKKEFTCSDRYSFAFSIIDIAYSLRFWGFVIVFAALLLSVILWIYLISAAGHSKDGGRLALNPLDRVPFDIVLAAEAAIMFLCLSFVFNYYDPETNVIFAVISVIIGYFFLLGTTLTAATRIKLRVLLKKTFIARVLRALKRGMSKIKSLFCHLFANISLVWKVALIGLVIAAAELLVIVTCWYNLSRLMLSWFIGNILLVPLLILIAIMLVRLKKGGERIAAGEVDAKVDTAYMFGDFKQFGETLNNIGSGLQTAVNERMKSERMKTELITNVSHDIKTPLTSIINYVDLIKKEDIGNDTVNEYIEVLDRQSTRLKKLIEDLVEASKASTGALRIESAPCDIGVLLSQATAEYGEKFSANCLNTVLNIPENAVTVLADGRYLWRVFDNLFNNICKYAMPSTRVYLDITETASKAVITFRNISQYPLNISSDELMERFVRGDASRNTEGSGLGLSIAKSLTELQNGIFDISIDGDLFKVQITFNKIKE